MFQKQSVYVYKYYRAAVAPEQKGLRVAYYTVQSIQRAKYYSDHGHGGEDEDAAAAAFVASKEAAASK